MQEQLIQTLGDFESGIKAAKEALGKAETVEAFSRARKEFPPTIVISTFELINTLEKSQDLYNQIRKKQDRIDVN